MKISVEETMNQIERQERLAEITEKQLKEFYAKWGKDARIVDRSVNPPKVWTAKMLSDLHAKRMQSAIGVKKLLQNETK